VIQVSGRLFPVEQRWRPFEESREYGLNERSPTRWTSCGASGAGDILVFLPGEREIREAADHLRKHLANHPQAARAGSRDPAAVRAPVARPSRTASSSPGNGRRIVLATNVAETSLTVPGIRYVIDAGTARVKRYSYRNKVEQLQIEPISQAAANQRAGRCGRVANGICIRLYDEKDFNARPRFTDPEILRSSLAGVILRMKSLHLGAVEDFPFLEAPPQGHRRRLPAAGRAGRGRRRQRADRRSAASWPAAAGPARGPHDPGGAQRESLTEVLVIASALSVQDVRDRPQEQPRPPTRSTSPSTTRSPSSWAT
jgi:ATP-dependent helicase HrpA